MMMLLGRRSVVRACCRGRTLAVAASSTLPKSSDEKLGPDVSVASQLRYLEKLATSKLFRENRASPTAIYERDLRYEELLSRAYQKPPGKLVGETEAWVVLDSYRRHGKTTVWTYNSFLRYVSKLSRGHHDAVIDLMKKDGLQPVGRMISVMLGGLTWVVFDEERANVQHSAGGFVTVVQGDGRNHPQGR